MATDGPLRRRVDKLTRLATMPRTVTTVASMIDTGSASTAQISAEIAKDQVIAMQVLKLVNSGFCGFRMPVTSISHATVLIGLDALRMLLFGTTLLNLEATRQMQGFWRHSLGTARAAGVLAELAGLQKAEEVAVAGLLHDIGKVVITQVAPVETLAIDRVVEEKGLLRIDAEREVLGLTHLEVGRWLAAKWALPDRLTYPVVFHNDFDSERDLLTERPWFTSPTSCAGRVALAFRAITGCRRSILAPGTSSDCRCPKWPRPWSSSRS